MDDPNLVLDFIRDERLNVLEELKEHELNLRKVIENVPMDEDFRDLLAVLINSYLSFEKNAAKALANIDAWRRGRRSAFQNIEPHSNSTALLRATTCTKVLADFIFKVTFIYILLPQMFY